MKTYEFGMIYNGVINHIRIQDNNLKNAEKRVLQLENAPKRAIQYWRVVPTASQIKKTKNLLRGI